MRLTPPPICLWWLTLCLAKQKRLTCLQHRSFLTYIAKAPYVGNYTKGSWMGKKAWNMHTSNTHGRIQTQLFRSLWSMHAMCICACAHIILYLSSHFGVCVCAFTFWCMYCFMNFAIHMLCIPLHCLWALDWTIDVLTLSGFATCHFSSVFAILWLPSPVHWVTLYWYLVASIA